MTATDRKGQASFGIRSVDSLLEYADRGICRLACQHPCKMHTGCREPIDKFRVNDNSRRHTFAWALLKLIFGINFQVDDAYLMSVIWKCFKSTCSNGHTGRNRHYIRADKRVCINPWHFATIDVHEALNAHVHIHGDLRVWELEFTTTPKWTLHTATTSDNQPEYHVVPAEAEAGQSWQQMQASHLVQHQHQHQHHFQHQQQAHKRLGSFEDEGLCGTEDAAMVVDEGEHAATAMSNDTTPMTVTPPLLRKTHMMTHALGQPASDEWAMGAEHYAAHILLSMKGRQYPTY